MSLPHKPPMTDTLNTTTGHLFGFPTRRNFLRIAAVAGAGLCLPPILAGCSDDSVVDPAERAMFDLSKPAGPLNLLYAHTLLMYDFYARVRKNTVAYPDQTRRESFSSFWNQKSYLARTYEYLIPAGRISDALYFNFSSVDFSSREGVLGLASKLENLGVGIAAGVGRYLQHPTDQLLAAQHASTCARHAIGIRYIQCLVQNGWNHSRLLNTDLLTADGRVSPIEPAEAVAEMQPYLFTTLTVR